MALLEIRNVSRRFGELQAVDDVSLSIEAGEFFTLVGPSGCGKTTLLRVIADLEPLSAGTVLVNGVPPHQARLARAYGYVFQAPALFPWRTVLGNVMLPLQIQGMDKAQRQAIAVEHLERVGLKGFEGKYPWQLSGGMQQRVAIARAYVLDPKVLILDDALASVDMKTASEIIGELRGLTGNQTRRTCIIVSQRMAAVEHADQIVVLDDGEIVERGNHAQLMALDGRYAAMVRREIQQAAEAMSEQPVMLSHT